MVKVQSHKRLASAHRDASHKTFLIVIVSLIALITIFLALFFVQNNVAGKATGSPDTPHLIAHYAFEDTAVDSTTNNLDGVAVGGTYVAGVEGKALEFNGAQSYVEVEKNTAYTLYDTNEFTISAWVKPNILGDGFGPSIFYDEDVTQVVFSQNNGASFFFNGGDGGINSYLRASVSDDINSNNVGTNNIIAGTWQHFVVVFDGSMLKLYKDGVKISEQTSSVTLTAPLRNRFRIGSDFAETVNSFDGALDEVKIWDGALADGDVCTEAGGSWNVDTCVASVSAEETDPTPVAHWDFETSPGNQDLSQNNNDLTVSGPIYSATGGKHNDGTLEFDGVDDIATAPDSDSLKITNSLTMSALFNNFDNGGNDGGIIVRKKGEYEMFVHQGKLFARVWYSPTEFNQVGGHEIESNTWYHVSVTFDGATLVMYLDGDEIDSISATQSITDTTDPVSLGRYEESNSVQFKGLLGDVKIFSVDLSAQKVCTNAGGSWETDTCVQSAEADLDNDGAINIDDLRSFIDEITEKYKEESIADQDGVGTLDWKDIKLFLREYVRAKPSG